MRRLGWITDAAEGGIWANFREMVRDEKLCKRSPRHCKGRTYQAQDTTDGLRGLERKKERAVLFTRLQDILHEKIKAK